MTEVTLEFIAKQQESLLAEIGQMRDDMAVMMGILQRMDGTVVGLVNDAARTPPAGDGGGEPMHRHHSIRP